MRASRVSSRRKAFAILSASAAAAAFGPASARATATNYTAGDAGNPTSWSQATNWSAGEPGSGAVANITSTSPTVYNVNYDYSGVSITLSTLTISQTNAGASGNSLSVSSSILTLNSNDIILGSSGAGAISQSIGVVNPGQLVLGNLAGDRGFYTLSGNGTLLNSANGMVIGDSGTGTFVQSGGSSTLTSSGSNSGLYLGYNAGGVGTYVLSAGTVTSNSFEFIGYGGTGNFNQTGGTNTTPSIMYIGFGGGSNGSYTLSNVGVLSTNAEFVGCASTGSFQQSGTSSNTTTELGVGGDGNNATGVYSLASGTLTVSGGGVTIIGYGGTGTFNQSGGTLNATGPMDLGGFTPTAGNGIYNFSGGLIDSSNGENVGNITNGAFNQSGGINIITSGDLVVGAGAISTGTYVLSGSGNLSVAIGVENIGVGASAPATFTQSGNSANATLALNVGDASVGSPTAAYTLGGTGTLTVNGLESIGATSNGVFTQTGGTNAIGTAGQLQLGTGIGVTGVYNLDTLSGGGLSLAGTSVAILGSSGTATFNQTGGFVSLGEDSGAESLFMAFNAGSVATYSLSGNGLLTSPGVEYDGYAGTSAIIQTGGVNNSMQDLIVGGLPGSLGSYSLSGTGNLNVATGELIGFQGTGSFVQTGGTNVVAEGLDVARLAGSVGNYLMSGGLLNSTDTSIGIYVGGSSFGTGGAGVLTVSGNAIINDSSVFDIFPTPGTSVTLSGGTINTAALSFNGLPSNFDWVSGTLGLTSGVTWDAAAGLTSTGGAFNAGLTLGANQVLNVTGNETLGGTGSFAMTLNSGSVHNVSGQLTVSPTGVLNVNGGALNYQSLVQSGGVINGTLTNQTDFTYQSGQFNAHLINEGFVSFGFNFTVGGGLQNFGEFSVNEGDTLTVNSTLDNLGSFSLEGGIISGAGPVINDIGGSMNASGMINPQFTNEGQLTLEGALRFGAASPALNEGVINGSGTIIGNFTNALGGSINVSEQLAFDTAWTNQGLVDLQSSSGILQGQTVTNTGTIEGAGTIDLPIANSGIIRPQSGELDVGGAGSASSNGAGGTIEVPSGGTIVFLQGLASNAGTILLSGGTFDNGNQAITSAGLIEGSGTLRTGGLTNNGTLYLLGSASVAGAVTNGASAEILLSGTGANVFTGAVVNNGTLVVDPGANGSLFGPYSGAGPIKNNGSLFVHANSVAGTITGSGTLTLGSVGSPTGLQLLSASSGNTQGALSVSTGSTLDVTSDALLLNYGSPAADPSAAIVAELASGYNGGHWNGVGILSTAAAANSAKFAVGYADGNADTGTPAGANQFVIAYTLAADANLDGSVGFADLVAVAENFGKTGQDWDHGNFTYDPAGSVGFGDLVLVAEEFGDTTAIGAQSGSISGLSPIWQDAQATAVVPEPATFGTAICAVGLLARRRVRKNHLA